MRCRGRCPRNAGGETYHRHTFSRASALDSPARKPLTRAWGSPHPINNSANEPKAIVTTKASHKYLLVQTARGPRRSTKFTRSGVLLMEHLTAQRTQETRQTRRGSETDMAPLPGHSTHRFRYRWGLACPS